MMILGGLLFLVLPFLWERMHGTGFDWRHLALGAVMAAVFFALAARYHRMRQEDRALSP